jgi:hypothetical protein
MDKTNAVVIWIMNVHFAIAPALIRRFQIDNDIFGLQLFVELINILDPDKDDAPSHSITGKRGKMEFDVVTRQAHVTRISAAKRSIRKSLPKSETSTIKLFRRG